MGVIVVSWSIRARRCEADTKNIFDSMKRPRLMCGMALWHILNAEYIQPYACSVHRVRTINSNKFRKCHYYSVRHMHNEADSNCSFGI